MKRILVALLFVPALTWAQHFADKWYFGVLAGLDFTSGNPVAISPSAINTNEGCSSISDSLGNLLFYTDGITVWNRLHQAMPNGSGLMGGISSTQSALVVPRPGSNTLYYIFTIDEAGGANGFRYSEVDMALDGGNGDVTANKNVFILDHVTEKLTAVKHSNGSDYWIAVHEWGSNAFYVYRLTAFGLLATPVISNLGIVHDSTQIQNTYGQMKFSVCGNKLALAAGYLDKAELFEFNNSTGTLSNPVLMPFSAHVYGIEFSPDVNWLYVSTYLAGGSIEQFDLSSGIPATIITSQTNVAFVTDVYALQLGPDAKIYVCKSFNSYLGVINSPNAPAASCNFVDNAISLDPNFNGVTSALGLPGFVQSFVGSVEDCLPTVIENISATDEFIYPNPTSDFFSIMFRERKPTQEITVFNVLNQVIEQLNMESENISFGKNYPHGIYNVIIKTEDDIKVIRAVKLK